MNRIAHERILLISPEQAFLEAFRRSLASVDRTTGPNEAAGKGANRWPGASALLRGLEIDSAANPQEAFDRLRRAFRERRPYPLVVVDLDRPCIEGAIQTVCSLVEIDPGVFPLLCKSEESGSWEAVARGLAPLDRFACVSKPLDPIAVRQAVASHLDCRLARDEFRRCASALESARRALDRADQRVEEAERAKTEFVANVSHEIRTPMNAILGFSRLLMKEPLSAGQLDKLHSLTEAGGSLLAIIDNLLDYSKLCAGEIKLKAADFSPDEVLRDVLDTVWPEVRRKGLVLECHTDDVTPRRLKGDRLRFQQVLTSLVGNAVKFTERGTIHVRTTLDEENESAATLRVVITDTGVGIPPERQACVFESFSQADGSATRCHGGLGLGLSISKRLADLMGGQIGFRSTVGRGSAFWFTATFEKPAPCGSAGSTSTAVERNTRLTAGGSDKLPEDLTRTPNEVRLLVAESDHLNRTLLEALLVRMRCFVDLVGDDREALAMIRRHRYDLVFMDVETPQMNGLEAIRRIRQEEEAAGRHVPIVALATLAAPADRQQCVQAGADDCIGKPFSGEAICIAIERYLPGLLEAAELESRVAASAESEEPFHALDVLADRVPALRRALQNGDFPDLETRAQTLRKLASKAGLKTVADHAMRAQLAARACDPERAATAIDRLDLASREPTTAARPPHQRTSLNTCP